MYCSNCGAQVNGSFCHNCGQAINYGNSNHKTEIKVADKIKNNEFFQSVRSDLDNSKSIDIIKSKVKEGTSRVNVKVDKKNAVIIALVAVAIIAVAAIASNLHKCCDCEKIFLGEEYIIDLWGEEEVYCEECYEEEWAIF